SARASAAVSAGPAVLRQHLAAASELTAARRALLGLGSGPYGHPTSAHQSVDLLVGVRDLRRGRLLGYRRHSGRLKNVLQNLLRVWPASPGAADLSSGLRRRGRGGRFLADRGQPLPADSALGLGRLRYPVRAAPTGSATGDPTLRSPGAGLHLCRGPYRLAGPLVLDHPRRPRHGPPGAGLLGHGARPNAGQPGLVDPDGLHPLSVYRGLGRLAAPAAA